MTDLPFLYDLGRIVVAAAVMVLLARLVRTPSIVAYLAAGLLLGPVTGLMEATETVNLIAEIGVSLLLFLVGLELSLDKIRDVGKVAVVAGVGQVVFTALGGVLLALLLGFTTIESVVIATALTFSSTVVVVKVLTQKHELDTLYGRIGVGIFLVQDMIAIVALTVLNGLGNPESLGAREVLGGLGGAFGGMLVLLVLAMASARYLLPRLFRWMSRSSEGLFIWSLTWCFLFVVGAALLDVSHAIGAFLAGVSLAQLPFNEELRRRVHPLMNFFVMVFFVSLGVQMELVAATRYWFAGIVLSLFVLIGNPFIFLWIIAKMGYTERTAFLTSVTVAQISEFSFVFAAVGLRSGLIDESVLSLIGVVGVITIAGSVYMILYNHPLYARVRRWGWLKMFRARQDDGGRVEGPMEELHGHVIVIGMNALGRRIVADLIEAGEQVVAIDSDPAKLRGLACRTIAGNTEYLAVLEEARLRSAKLLVSALQIEDANNLLAFRGREMGVPTSIHAFDQLLEEELRQAGAEHLIRSKSAGTRRIAREFARKGLLGP